MTASIAEQTLQAQLEQAGIAFESEYRFHPERRWRADFVASDADHWELFGPSAAPFVVLIEIDGGSWVAGRHTRGKGFENDLDKLNAAALLGYRVLRFTPAMVADGRAFAVIREALGMERAA